MIEEQLKKHGNVVSVTEGDSMRPLFKTHRDTVAIEKIDSDLKKYDVVLYKSESGTNFVLHRIVKVRSDGVFVIRGDNTYRNEYVRECDIIGRLAGFNRKGKGYTDVDSFGYKFYSRFWVLIYPLRYIFRIPVSFVKRVFRRLFVKKSKK